jgi:hypothetical protein
MKLSIAFVILSILRKSNGQTVAPALMTNITDAPSPVATDAPDAYMVYPTPSPTAGDAATNVPNVPSPAETDAPDAYMVYPTPSPTAGNGAETTAVPTAGEETSFPTSDETSTSPAFSSTSASPTYNPSPAPTEEFVDASNRPTTNSTFASTEPAAMVSPLKSSRDVYNGAMATSNGISGVILGVAILVSIFGV